MTDYKIINVQSAGGDVADPENLEIELNRLARHGWRVVAVLPAAPNSHSIILERDLPIV